MYHTEASQSTCNANQVTGFYIQFTWTLIENKVTITDTCKPLIRSLFKSSVVLKIIKGWFFQACLYCLSRLHDFMKLEMRKKKKNQLYFIFIYSAKATWFVVVGSVARIISGRSVDKIIILNFKTGTPKIKNIDYQGKETCAMFSLPVENKNGLNVLLPLLGLCNKKLSCLLLRASSRTNG